MGRVSCRRTLNKYFPKNDYPKMLLRKYEIYQWSNDIVYQFITSFVALLAEDHRFFLILRRNRNAHDLRGL